jgi:hypothetical protein
VISGVCWAGDLSKDGYTVPEEVAVRCFLCILLYVLNKSVVQASFARLFE